MAAFYCQELIKNTHVLCKSYIQRLIQEKSQKKKMLRDIENELYDFDKSQISSSDQDNYSGGGRRTSYYVEENERILNLLITNCEPILTEMVKQVNHFNTYNKIQRVVDKAGITFDEISIAQDCRGGVDGPMINAQKLYHNTQSNSNIPNTTAQQSNYKQLKNTYITQIKTNKTLKTSTSKDELDPEFLERKKKVELNESTYYNTRGQDGQPISPEASYFTQLRNNVKTILGVKEQDDWIFNLNIGNVMHLLPMSLEELNLHVDNSHELSRDAMLEKIILLSVSYFCVGTELRFLSANNKDTKPPAPAKKVYGVDLAEPEQGYTKADSEMWHAQALETCGTFLPSECPLVSHVIVSYQKHHSPAMQTIPEDEPLQEELKVIRPLNEVKNDQVNYHQIIRAYNTQQYRVQLTSRMISSRNSSRPQTSASKRGQVNQNIFYMTTQGNESSHSKIKVNKKGYQTASQGLLEPDEDSQMLHTANRTYQTMKNTESPLPKAKSPPNMAQQLAVKMITQNLNHHHQSAKPPVGQKVQMHHHQPNSRNVPAPYILSTTASEPINHTMNGSAKRPSTAKAKQTFKGLDLNQRLMQTMNLGSTIKTKNTAVAGLTNGTFQSLNKKPSSSSRLSSANGSQQRKSVNSSRTRLVTNESASGAMRSPKNNIYASTNKTSKPKKVLLTQRLLVETQNLGHSQGGSAGIHSKKKSSGATSSRPMVSTPQGFTNNQQLLNLQNLIQHSTPNHYTTSKKQMTDPQHKMINGGMIMLSTGKSGLGPSTKAKLKLIKLK